MLCEDCGQSIPAERLEILPDTTTCVGCSTVEKVKDYQTPIIKEDQEYVDNAYLGLKVVNLQDQGERDDN